MLRFVVAVVVLGIHFQIRLVSPANERRLFFVAWWWVLRQLNEEVCSCLCFQSSSGLIFVVDSIDRERIEEAQNELLSIVTADEMRNVPVEIIANKQDLPSQYSNIYHSVNSINLYGTVREYFQYAAAAPECLAACNEHGHSSCE